MKVTLVFDIGKTNKKCFLFDEKYQQVFREYSRFDEIRDDDGDFCDDLSSIGKWLQSTYQKIANDKKFDIKAINFSTYGASLVHIDKNGIPVAPLYNYLKDYPEELLEEFHSKYGDTLRIAKETASPASGMLNSGFQLYWLKHTKPEIFKKIRRSLHFPQYLSFLFTGIAVSDYTSIGCHTSLWDFGKKDYHDWVYAEGFDKILPTIVDATTSINKDIDGKTIKVGVGIHDSSSALLPYIRADKKPFLLISTGTWSISLNPFNAKVLSEEDLQNDCLNYMQINGNPVKAARLFLGNEYNLQVKRLNALFDVGKEYHHSVKFDEAIYGELEKDNRNYFEFESIAAFEAEERIISAVHFKSYEEGYHQLMIELLDLQFASAERAIGETEINKIYIDGGFATNDVYVNLLSRHFPKCKMRTTNSPLGSALGAALVISDKAIKRKFLKKHYAMKKV